MATLRDIRRKINSVKSTQQITRAMKMVAAAKLRRAQDRVNRIRPYADAISGMLANVSGQLDEPLNPFLEARADAKVAFLVVSADRGLCGSFNSNLLRRAHDEVDAARAAGKTVKLITVGRKATEYFRKREYDIDFQLINIFRELHFDHALEAAQAAKDLYLSGGVDRVSLIYTHAESMVKQDVRVEQLLPVVPAEVAGEGFNKDYIFEPEPQKILDALCPKAVNVAVWTALAISYFGEEGARMVAMDNATENAQEIVNNLTLHYNKVRQAAITREITEIVAGAEALK